MKPKNHLNIWTMLLAILMIWLTAIFISLYCGLFDILNAMPKKRLLDYPLLTFFIAPFFFWISAYLCRKYSPNAAGNHLQSALLELKKHPHDFEKASPFLNVRLVVVKTISSLISSFGGGALGKEGPATHMSASIFAIFGQRYKNFLPKITLETWILAGCASGLTMAFNSPIAGIVFAAEKSIKMGNKNFQQSISWTLLTVAIITLIFHKSSPVFIFRAIDFVSEIDLKFLVITAVICGIICLIVKKISFYFLSKTSAIKSNWWHLIPITAGLIVAGISFYSGVHSFGGGISTLQKALSSDTILLSYKEVGGRILNTIFTFSSGSAGGLIVPAMAIGAGIGSIVSAIAENSGGIFLLIGMAAFLSVMLGEPITAAVLVFETTGQNIQALPFLIAATLISFATGKWIEKIN